MTTEEKMPNQILVLFHENLALKFTASCHNKCSYKGVLKAFSFVIYIYCNGYCKLLFIVTGITSYLPLLNLIDRSYQQWQQQEHGLVSPSACERVCALSV